MTGGHLARWLRGAGAAVLVAALLPLSAGTAVADSAAGRAQEDHSANCRVDAPGHSMGKNGQGNDCSTPAAADASSAAASTALEPVTAEHGPAAAEGAAQGQVAHGAVAADVAARADESASQGKHPSKADKADKPSKAPNDSKNSRDARGSKDAKGSKSSPAAGASTGAASVPAPTTDAATRTGGQKSHAQQRGHTPVHVCHATSSDSNPYVFITVDDDSVKLRGHLMHRNQPNKTWKSDGVFRGVQVKAGDSKRDLIGDYTDHDGVVHVYDGPITKATGCGSLTPPPPPPPTVAPTGSFDAACTAAGALATVGVLSSGSATGGSFRLVSAGFSALVSSGQTLAVPADADIRLEYVAAAGNVQTLQTRKSPNACPPTTPPGEEGELTKSAVPASGSVVTVGQTIGYTVTVRNTGRVDITASPVVDTLPEFVTVVAGSVSDGGQVSADGRTITWSASLAPGAGETYTYQGLVAANAPSGTLLVNKVTFLRHERTTSHPVGDRSLVVSKAVSAAVAQFGDSLTYTLTVRAGGSLGQTGVVVTDRVPAGTTYAAGSASCDTPGACAASYNAGVLSWSLGSMAAGTTRTVTFRVTVDTPGAEPDGGVPAVTIRNIGSVSSTEVPTTPSNEVVTDVVAVGGVKFGHNSGGSGEAPTPGDAVEAAPSGDGVLASTGAGLPLGLVLLLGVVMLAIGGVLLRTGWSARRQGVETAG